MKTISDDIIAEFIAKGLAKQMTVSKLKKIIKDELRVTLRKEDTITLNISVSFSVGSGYDD